MTCMLHASMPVDLSFRFLRFFPLDLSPFSATLLLGFVQSDVGSLNASHCPRVIGEGTRLHSAGQRVCFGGCGAGSSANDGGMVV